MKGESLEAFSMADLWECEGYSPSQSRFVKNVHAVLGKIMPNNSLSPTRVSTCPLGNPGAATDIGCVMKVGHHEPTHSGQYLPILFIDSQSISIIKWLLKLGDDYD